MPSNGKPAFTQQQAERLRSEYRAGKITAPAMAKREGVALESLRDLLSGRTYRGNHPLTIQIPSVLLERVRKQASKSGVSPEAWIIRFLDSEIQ